MNKGNKMDCKTIIVDDNTARIRRVILLDNCHQSSINPIAPLKKTYRDYGRQTVIVNETPSKINDYRSLCEEPKSIVD